jgi:hypothetical protein
MSWSNGKPMVKDAYAQGKMLDNSSWKLARGSSPCDADSVQPVGGEPVQLPWMLDSHGCFIWGFIERGSANPEWLSVGQRRVLSGLAKLPGNHVCCVMKHNVPVTRQINTKHDIEEVCVVFDMGARQHSIDNNEWITFVESWARNAKTALDWLRSKANLAATVEEMF